jgi:hypothetical protein
MLYVDQAATDSYAVGGNFGSLNRSPRTARTITDRGRPTSAALADWRVLTRLSKKHRYSITSSATVGDPAASAAVQPSLPRCPRSYSRHS